MLTDPCYIDGEWWVYEPFQDIRRYKDTQTDKIYQYYVDFVDYEQELEGGKTTNQLISSKQWVELPEPETHTYSYNGACRSTLSEKAAGQLNYRLGHVGAGVVVRSGCGDGTYPVFIKKNSKGQVTEAKIVFIEEDEK